MLKASPAWWNNTSLTLPFAPNSLPTSTTFVPLLLMSSTFPTSLLLRDHLTLRRAEDSLKCHAILGKQYQEGKPKFPYCFKCNKSHPNHVKEECPLWKMCHWCLSTQHAHNDCNCPHEQCDTEYCTVPYTHSNFGDKCTAMLSPTLCHKLELARTDYDEEFYAVSY